MSTKMHNYRIHKPSLWKFADACRKYYRENHPFAQIALKPDDVTYSKLFKAVDEIVAQDWTVELQLFDEGRYWLIRPLEQGYFFMNHAEEIWPKIQRVSYDNRSDVPPEQEKNKVVAEWVDKKIHNHQYLTFNVLSRDDFADILLQKLMEHVHERAISQ